MAWLTDHPWVLALAIVLARLADVSLGTVRTILVIRGHGILAAGIGFVEVLIWLAAAAQVLKNLEHWYLAVAYAGGFALGNLVGAWLESKLAIGSELVRVISRDRDVNLAENLRARGHSVTELVGTGDGDVPVEVLLVVQKRRRVPHLLQEILDADPRAICTISDVRPFPHARRPVAGNFLPGGLLGLGRRK